MKIEKLAAALAAAKNASQALRNSGDGGTCNFDTAVFFLRQNGLTEKVIKEASALSGVTVDVRRWMKLKCAFVEIGEGQGSRRTTMAEAACEALKDSGVEATMYYHMD